MSANEKPKYCSKFGKYKVLSPSGLSSDPDAVIYKPEGGLGKDKMLTTSTASLKSSIWTKGQEMSIDDHGE